MINQLHEGSHEAGSQRESHNFKDYSGFFRLTFYSLVDGRSKQFYL